MCADSSPKSRAPKLPLQKLTDLRRTRPPKGHDVDEGEAKNRPAKKVRLSDSGQTENKGEETPKKAGAGNLGSLIGRKRKERKTGK